MVHKASNIYSVVIHSRGLLTSDTELRNEDQQGAFVISFQDNL